MSSESIIHHGAVTLRVVGTGLLQMQMRSLDYTKTADLLPLTMASTNDREPTRLCNFNTQRAFLKVYTTRQGDHMKINRMIIWVKPIATQYPS